MSLALFGRQHRARGGSGQEEWRSRSQRLDCWPGCCWKDGAGHRGGRKASFLETTPQVCWRQWWAHSQRTWLAEPAGTVPLLFARYLLPEKPYSQAGSHEPVPKTQLEVSWGASLGELLYPLARDSHGRRAHGQMKVIMTPGTTAAIS